MPIRLLRVVGPVHVVAGLALFATAFIEPVLTFLETSITGNQDFAWSAFFVTVLGPTIASWGLLFTVMVEQYLASRSLQLWRALLLSVIVWAPLDTALCLKFGVYAGALINTIVFVAVIALLLLVRRSDT